MRSKSNFTSLYTRMLWLLLVLPVYHSLQAQQASKVETVKLETLIFPLQDQHVHGASLVELPNGDFLAVWFQGSGERNADDVRIMGARLASGNKEWSKPFLMADTPRIPDCNPVLFLNAQNKLFLVWIAVLANRWEQSVLRLRVSNDYSQNGAPTWEWQDNILLKPGKEFEDEVASTFSKLPKSEAGWSEYAQTYDAQIIEASKDAAKRSIGWMTRIKPLVEEDGRIILPLYSDGFNFSMMALSEDHGKIWKPSLPLVGRGPIQPALARRKNGDIVALMRDSGDAPGRVHNSVSLDGGKSWSVAEKTDMPNTASVELLKWDEDNWFFLGNDIDDGRYRLSLYRSQDEGESWELVGRLEEDESKSGSFSYPCLIRGSDHKLHITYSYHLSSGLKSIKYKVLDPSTFFH